MKLWNARLRDDGDDYQTDEIGTELPTLKGLASSASEGEASESQQHQEQQYRPYPLLTPTKLMRKQSSLDEPQTPVSLGFIRDTRALKGNERVLINSVFHCYRIADFSSRHRSDRR
jgi:hypothetical protein